MENKMAFVLFPAIIEDSTRTTLYINGNSIFIPNIDIEALINKM